MPVLIWSSCVIEIIRVSPVNFLFLLILQVVNGTVWYFEDRNSRSALDTVRRSLEPHSTVRRDGTWRRVLASDLVVGDKIMICTGDIVPADCLAGSGECVIDQWSLTGESLPLLKTEGSKMYMGSIVKSGEVEASVVATGSNTYFQKTNLLSSQVSQKGKTERVLKRIAFLLIMISSVIVTVILIVYLVKGNEFLESLSTSVVLMVISLPIAMQAVSAAIYAVGAKKLKKKQAIICKLSSIEELAGMEVLCFHKNGVLTKQEPTVHNPVLYSCKSIEELFFIAYLASKKDGKNFVDNCICSYAKENCKVNTDLYEEEGAVHYDSRIKKSEVTIRNTRTGEIFKCCKGSPQVILPLIQDSDLEKKVTEDIRVLASQGYSSIAVARTNSCNLWSIAGLITIFDPFFDGSEECIHNIKSLNIKTLFLTGGQNFFAKELSSRLNIGDCVISSEIFNNNSNVTKNELIDEIIMKTDGFSEVYPEHKFTIVKILQRQKKKTGVTGISVNDTSALRSANVGLAGYGATDAAKMSADIIYNRPGLRIIYKSIVNSRKIFQRTETYCVYRVCSSLQLLLLFFVAAVAINPKTDYKCSGSDCENIPNTFGLPVVALVIIAMLNDGAIISISHDHISAQHSSCRWNLIKIFMFSSIIGSISFISSFVFILFCLSNLDSDNPNSLFKFLGLSTFTYGEVLAATFLKASLSSYLTIFSIRSKTWFFLTVPGKILLCASVLAMTVSTFLCKYWHLNVQPRNSKVIANLTSISWDFILVIWVYCVLIFVLQDVVKMMIYKFNIISVISFTDKAVSKKMINEFNYVCQNLSDKCIANERTKATI